MKAVSETLGFVTTTFCMSELSAWQQGWIAFKQMIDEFKQPP